MTTKSTQKQIDVLFEDPKIPNQSFALISIVGPHMPQKCDVWGLKIRGVAEDLERAKTMTKKLMRIDNNYDIYTVEVGKFFPLAVEPHQLNNVEYENKQLNDLIKNYLENREMANEQWHARKAEMIQKAIKEGRSQEEMANRPEHPVAVLQRLRKTGDNIKETKTTLMELEELLKRDQEKFSKYTDEEKELAMKELESAITNNLSESKSQTISVDEIRDELLSGLNNNNDDINDNDVELILTELKNLENELDELNEVKTQLNSDKMPKFFNKIMSSIKKCENEISALKEKLQNKDLVNEFINSSYTNSQYEYLQEINNVKQ